MATPEHPVEPTEHDEKQDERMQLLFEELLEERQKRAAMAEILSNQEIYMPKSLMEKESGPPAPPTPSQEAPIWGNDGYRCFPVNGAWLSLRGDDPFCAALRDQFKSTYKLSSKIFWERQVTDEKGETKIIIVE